VEVGGECHEQHGDGYGDKPAAGSGVVASEDVFYRLIAWNDKKVFLLFSFNKPSNESGRCFDITDFRLVRKKLFFIHFPSALY
jgi:hypothetical protein